MLMAAEPRALAGDASDLSGANLAASRLSDFRRGQLAQVQRARILAGAVQVVAERGSSNAAISEIVQRAGVSRRTYYEIFVDRDECLVAAFDDALSIAAARVLPAIDGQRTWLSRLRAGVVALMGFLEDEPQLGRLLICESLSGGRALSEWRAQVVALLVAFVDEGHGQGEQAKQVSAMQADGSVGGALAVLQNLLSSGEPADLVEHSGSLVAMIALPYVGRAAARRELERPTTARERPASKSSDSPSAHLMPELPFKAAGMRLTYRTIRVLVAIAERPGTSNREIGDLAEIGDQGQMSKLLGRLRRAGLVFNDGVAPGQGAPNAWRLTDAGRELAEGMRAYSSVSGARGTVDGVSVARRSGLSVRRRDDSHDLRRGK